MGKLLMNIENPLEAKLPPSPPPTLNLNYWTEEAQDWPLRRKTFPLFSMRQSFALCLLIDADSEVIGCEDKNIFFLPDSIFLANFFWS